MDILVNVINQKLKIQTNIKNIIAGSQKFIKFIFNLPREWDNLTTFAQFSQNGASFNVYLDENNSVFLPPEIEEGKFTLTLYGSNEDVIATTDYITLVVYDNILVEDSQSTVISTSLYNQLVTKINSISISNPEQNNVIYAESPPNELTPIVADGLTDSTVALQEIIDYANSIGGATIQLPRGEIKITSKIMWKDKVSLVGAGMYETTIVPYGTNFSAIDFDESTGEYGFGENEEDPRFTGISFRDFGIDGSNTYANTENAKVGTKGIFLVFLERVLFQNLYIRNTIGTGLGIDELRDCLIDNVHLDNCGRLWQAGGLGQAGIGIGTGGMPNESFVIRNCVARNCGHYGIFIELQDFGGQHTQYTSQKILIDGCSVEDTRNDGFNAYYADDLQIVGCRSVNNARNGFSCWGAMNRVIVSDSIFESNGGSGFDVSSAISGQGKDTFLIDNTIICNNSSHGININNDGVSTLHADNITISRCDIYSNGATGARFGSTGYCDNLTLIDTNIHDNGVHGIIFNISGEHQLIDNCHIYNNGTEVMDAGFYVAGGTHTNTILRNVRIHDNKVGMRLSGDATWVNPWFDNIINTGNDTDQLGNTPEGAIKPAYTLPVAGTALGGVKNGGNVTVNADGTMTAPSGGAETEKKWKLFDTVTVEGNDTAYISWGNPNTGDATNLLFAEKAKEVFVFLSSVVGKWALRVNSADGGTRAGEFKANNVYARLISDSSLKNFQTIFTADYNVGQSIVHSGGAGTDNNPAKRFDYVTYVSITCTSNVFFPDGMTAELYVR